jgi:YD repeat-containing protein
VTHYIYDTNGEQLSATDPTGALSQATYDYLGRPKTSTQVVRRPSAYTTTNACHDVSGSGAGWLVRPQLRRHSLSYCSRVSV